MFNGTEICLYPNGPNPIVWSWDRLDCYFSPIIYIKPLQGLAFLPDVCVEPRRPLQPIQVTMQE